MLLCHKYRMAIRVLHIDVGWYYPSLGTLLAVNILLAFRQNWSRLLSPCHVVHAKCPTCHVPTSIYLLQICRGNNGVPLWCWLVAPITSSNFYSLWMPCCLGWSGWSSPCPVVLLVPSLHGPTSISLLQLYKGYNCVPHWCGVVAPISCHFIGCVHDLSIMHLGWSSWWFSLCPPLLLVPSLHGPTSMSLYLIIERL
jgi:hypothetical protein